MKRWAIFLVSVSALVLSCASQKAPAPAAENKPAVTHPELPPGEKWMACSECHKMETPEIYEEWYKSRHGIAMVKCFQCHGTFETFHKPTRETCRTCHAKQYKNCPADRPCWDCHAPHLFKKKVQ